MYGIQERKKRWQEFLSMDGSTKNVFLIHYNEGLPPRPPLWPDKKRERIEWIVQVYERKMEQLEWLLDDSIPHLKMLTGPEIFAEAFGCPVYRPDDNMPFARPLIHSASEVSKLKVPGLSSSSLAYLFDMADEVKKRTGDDAVMQLVDVQSPMDIASLIWDKNDFYIAMITDPEAVKELAAKVKELLTAFLDEWFRRYGTEFIAHFPDYYMPCGITLSEDEIGSVSEEMFMEFFYPELVELSERYGGIGIHCCAHARHQWENLKKIPNLRLLNLIQPPKVLKSAYSFFADHVPQMHGWAGDGPAWTWFEQLPSNAHTAIEVHASTKEQALELSEKLWEACGRG